MARAYLADGEKAKAFGELDAAFKIDPSSVGVLRELGLLAIALADEASKQGDAAQKDSYLDRAEKTFKALLMQKLEEGSPISKAQVFFHLGDLSFRRGDTKKAIQMLERALDTDKSYEAAKTMLAELKSRPSVV